MNIKATPRPSFRARTIRTNLRNFPPTVVLVSEMGGNGGVVMALWLFRAVNAWGAAHNLVNDPICWHLRPLYLPMWHAPKDSVYNVKTSRAAHPRPKRSWLTTSSYHGWYDPSNQLIGACRASMAPASAQITQVKPAFADSC